MNVLGSWGVEGLAARRSSVPRPSLNHTATSRHVFHAQCFVSTIQHTPTPFTRVQRPGCNNRTTFHHMGSTPRTCSSTLESPRERQFVALRWKVRPGAVDSRSVSANQSVIIGYRTFHNLLIGENQAFTQETLEELVGPRTYHQRLPPHLNNHPPSHPTRQGLQRDS